MKRLVEESLGRSVEALEEIGGGRNSRVYKVIVAPSQAFALKAYFTHASDQRDRMRTEFESLSFLWRNGLRNIPQPVTSNADQSFAIYHWIHGSRIAAHDVDESAIDAAAALLGRLTASRKDPESSSFAPASEACFSGSALVQNLEHRLSLLRSQNSEPELQAFLESKFAPSFKAVSDWSRRLAGADFERELDPTSRILSPSDFGFHNALRTPGGAICFLDFEYFGWDDPAKTISDFLLHPAMALPPAFKRRFVASAMEQLGCTSSFAVRLRAFYPLLGLKWCLILLNEFLPEQMLRRRFAGNSGQTHRTQAEQLQKAEEKLQQTLTEYEHLPYID